MRPPSERRASLTREGAGMLRTQKRRPMFRPHPFVYLHPGNSLLNAEIGKDLGLRFVYGEQVVAYGAILRDSLAIFRCMVAIMAAEAARIAHVSDVIGMRSPSHFHLGKHVGRKDSDQSIACGLYKLRFRRQHIRMFAAIKSCQLLRNFRARFSLGCVIALE